MRRWGIAAAGVLVGAGTVALVLVLTLSTGASSRAREVTTDAVVSTEEEPRAEVVLIDRPFRCLTRVDLDLVRVTMRTAMDDAITLDENCSGRIGRIEVETWTEDGIKVQNSGRVAHDLVIESGYVKCRAFALGAHQDGIQVMGGLRLTFRDLRVDCLGNANLFLAEGGSGAETPTDVVCVRCVLGPHSAQTLYHGKSIRSGARQTTICTGRHFAVRVEPGARAIVDEGNTVLPRDDAACKDVVGEDGAA